jgi:peptide/nickel transport system substrate-binding protein
MAGWSGSTYKENAMRVTFACSSLALALIATASLVGVSLAQPSPLPTSPPPTAPGRREVRIAVPSLALPLDPTGALEGPTALISRQVFDSLVAYREGSTDVEPGLATRWAVSREGLVWTFTLRDNVRFHDGAALGAADVVASFERQLKTDLQQRPPVWGALLRGTPGVIREVRAVDAKTVQFVLAQPYAPLLTVLAHPGLGVTRQVTMSDGAVRLVGTGSYRVAAEAPGRLTLEAAPGHWGGPARSERLVFIEVASDEQASADLDAGALDLWFPAGAPARDAGALSVPGLRVGYLAFQTEKEPFARKKARQALAAAIDPAGIGAALGRAAVPLQSFLPPGVWARREGSPLLGGSREAVLKMLGEAGWPQGFSPVLVAPSEPGPIDPSKLGEVLQAMLEAVKISVRLRVETGSTAQNAQAAGEHDLALAEARVVGGDPHLFLYPLSTSEGATRGPKALNYSFYRNPRLDDVLIRASQLAFRPERQRLYHRAQAILADEMPWLPLYVRLVWGVARPEVRGLRLHPTGLHRLSTISLAG